MTEDSYLQLIKQSSEGNFPSVTCREYFKLDA